MLCECNSVPQQIQGDSVQPEYIVRVQSDRPYTFGLGEVVSDRVVLFRDGNWGIGLDEVQQKLKQLTTPLKAH